MQKTIFFLLITCFSSFLAAQCNIALPNDTVICSNPISYVLNPTGSNFIQYQWNTGDTAQNITATQAGYYTVIGTDSSGCKDTASIYIQTSFVNYLDLGQDLSLCGTSGTGILFTANASIYVDAYTDSIRIIYDATNGVSGLVGANKVYMHSGAEYLQNGGWQTVVGNWGQDDGIGEMDSIAPNKWQIIIYPQSYYGYYPNDSLWGIFMVFRNADGSATGKDNNNNDFYLDLHTNTLLPLSNYQLAMYANYTSSMPTYLWNTGEIAPFISQDSSGFYGVIVTDINNCSVIDSMHTQYYPYPTLHLGNDTILCTGDTLFLAPGYNYTNYDWNTGDSSASISITNGGYYTVIVSNQIGCESFEDVFVNTSLLAENNTQIDTTLCPGQNISFDASTYLIQKGDSIQILYDATQGQTALMGANSVYFHAGAEITPFGGWQYVTGNWGQDDGIGKMDSLGNNLWTITIHPQTYFGYSPTLSLEGIFMVFRNADGTATGKDANGDDIYLFTNNGTNTPTSTFAGINGQYAYPQNTAISYLWNTNATTPAINVNSGGLYTVQINDGYCNINNYYALTYTQPVVAQFNMIAVQCHFEFTNLSTNATTYTWDFGDGALPVYATNVVHNYNQNGQYLVTLIASNECFVDTFTMTINCNVFSVEENETSLSDIQLYPNPTQDLLHISFDCKEKENIGLSIINLLGENILKIPAKSVYGTYKHTFSTNNWAKGIYLLQINHGKGIEMRRFVVH